MSDVTLKIRNKDFLRSHHKYFELTIQSTNHSAQRCEQPIRFVWAWHLTNRNWALTELWASEYDIWHSTNRNQQLTYAGRAASIINTWDSMHMYSFQAFTALSYTYNSIFSLLTSPWLPLEKFLLWSEISSSPPVICYRHLGSIYQDIFHPVMTSFRLPLLPRLSVLWHHTD